MSNHDIYSLGFMSYCSHDPAASMVRLSVDGQVDFIHFEEGMLSRRKKSYHFPARAINACLNHFGVEIGRVDAVCVDFMDHKRFLGTTKYYRRLVGDYVRANLNLRSDQIFFADSHHLAHAYTALAGSGYDDAAVLVVDGLGSEQQTHSVYWTEGGLLKLQFSQHTPGIGALYSLVTETLGFEAGEEGKTMGLAPYGQDLRSRDDWDLEGYRLDLTADYSRIVQRSPSVRLKVDFSSKLADESLYLGAPASLAHAVQEELERSLLHLATEIQFRSGKTRLCYAGGVALNCVANELIANSRIFSDVYVHADSGDSGLPFGLALIGLEKFINQTQSEPVKTDKILRNVGYPLYAPATADSEGMDAISGLLSQVDLGMRPVDLDAIVDALANGSVISWFEGGWEYGPRALGHRSFLADARGAHMKQVLNEKIKHREPYRPFAPICLEEDFDRFFVSSHRNHRTMLYAVDCTDEAVKKIPAVVHVDGTARVQILGEESGSVYKVLKRFKDKTGIGVLINTSLNDNNEPIVFDPLDALGCFLRTNSDILVINDQVIGRDTIDLNTLARLKLLCDEAIRKRNHERARAAYSKLIIAEPVNFTDWMREQNLSHQYQATRSSYDRIVDSLAGWDADGIRFPRLVTDTHHLDVLQEIRTLSKLDYEHVFSSIKLVDDDHRALGHLREGDYVLAYNLSSILREDPVLGKRFPPTMNFYLSSSKIIGPILDRIDKGSAIEQILETYEVDTSKDISDFFAD